jgi:MEMO1 family protein
MIRPPAVAGSFYPADPAELAREIDVFLESSGPKKAVRGCIVPHAGYMYSGHVAGAVYSAVEIPGRAILLGPRHYPRGEPLAIFQEGAWRTPFGEARIEDSLASALLRECPRLRNDAIAHQREHSLEVQIPFLQRLQSDLHFVPVVLVSDRFPVLEELGRAVARVVKRQSEPVLVIASTDMNHYESDSVTRAKDRRAIDRILALDPRGLFDTVRNEGITMCGYAATVATLVAMAELGASEVSLVRYATSGEVSQNKNRVVGYAGFLIS